MAKAQYITTFCSNIESPQRNPKATANPVKIKGGIKQGITQPIDKKKYLANTQ